MKKICPYCDKVIAVYMTYCSCLTCDIVWRGNEVIIIKGDNKWDLLPEGCLLVL